MKWLQKLLFAAQTLKWWQAGQLLTRNRVLRSGAFGTRKWKWVFGLCKDGPPVLPSLQCAFERLFHPQKGLTGKSVSSSVKSLTFSRGNPHTAYQDSSENYVYWNFIHTLYGIIVMGALESWEIIQPKGVSSKWRNCLKNCELETR